MVKKMIPNSGGCKAFEMDLTDYVMGDMTFLTKEKQQKLFEHIRKCPKCQRQVWLWKGTLSVMTGRSQPNQPKPRKRLNDLLKQAKLSAVCRPKAGKKHTQPTLKPVPGKLLNHEEREGTAAGVVCHCLAQNGWMKMTDLSRKVKLPTNILERAVGWLACQKKIYESETPRNTYLFLAPKERRIYQTRM